MKARYLKKLLNDTGYIISNNNDYIAVGNPRCHNLISVDKTTLAIKYALDFKNEGRKSLERGLNTELLFISDKLTELIENGKIREIIDGRDEIENPLPVYSIKDGELLETITDAYGWPNTDDNGVVMYNNTHFPTKKEAIKSGIEEYEALADYLEDTIKDARERLERFENRQKTHQYYVAKLKGMLNEL